MQKKDNKQARGGDKLLFTARYEFDTKGNRDPTGTENSKQTINIFDMFYSRCQ
jgi:hypothetical protein